MCPQLCPFPSCWLFVPCPFQPWVGVPQSAGLTASLLQEVMHALKMTWHVQCFTCAACKTPIRNRAFYMEEGQPYCERGIGPGGGDLVSPRGTGRAQHLVAGALGELPCAAGLSPGHGDGWVSPEPSVPVLPGCWVVPALAGCLGDDGGCGSKRVLHPGS